VPWEYKKSLPAVIGKLKRDEYEIIAIEQDTRSINYRKIKPKNKVAIIVGPEVEGLSKNILDKCDVIVQIPMHGKKESLNVSVACGIALFRILQS
jgi:tRNA G18 (ribose-2'-O)-methylase SpoU